MRVFFDVSVLVAACVEGHPEHERWFAWLARAHRGEIEMVVANHTLTELYAVLTRLPIRPRPAPSVVRRMLRDNIEAVALVGDVSVAQYKAVLDDLASRGLSGGLVYAALAANVAMQEGIDVVLTLNRKDFLQVWPEGAAKIRKP